MKLKILISLTCIFQLSIAQQSVSISGQILHPKADKVFIRYYTDFLSYKEATADSAILDKKGNFKMTFSWEVPFPAFLYYGDDIMEMFLTPGDSLSLQLDAKRFDPSLTYTGKGSRANKHILENLLLENFPTGDIYRLPEEEYISWVDSVTEQTNAKLIDDFKMGLSSDPNVTAYINYAQNEIIYNQAYLKLAYPGMNAYANKQKGYTSVSSAYYDFLSEIKFDNPDALISENYHDFILKYANHQAQELYKQDTTKTFLEHRDLLASQMSVPVNEFLLAAWSYNGMTEEGELERGKKWLDKLKFQVPGSEYISLLEQAYDEMLKLSPGNLAPDFTFKDVKGKEVSLRDFRGKIVYLDFWATWCGPCRREIPPAKELEASLKGKDVVFLAVSLDESDKSWKDMIKKQELPGIHLLSPGGFDSNAAQLYRVEGIPRYYLIDRNGLIVDNDAPRPSDGAKDAIEKELMK